MLAIPSFCAAARLSLFRSRYKGAGRQDQSEAKKSKGGDPWRAETDISYSSARDLARQQELTGYSSLPSEMAKNLARGKPYRPVSQNGRCRAARCSAFLLIPVTNGKEMEITW